MQPDQIALQLYTVRRLLADNVGRTLASVAAAGYRSVEVAGVPDAARSDLPRLLSEAGLTAIAVHEGLERLRGGLPAVTDWLGALGCSRLVVPSLPEDERATVAGLRRLITELNDLARPLADRGVRLGYHNHSAEFGPLEDTTAWDVLLAELDPGIEIELDVYWASIGGRDPAAEIGRASDRVRLLHMKDRAAGVGAHDAPAGQGILDFASIVAAARVAGVEWFIAEQDEPSDELRDIRTARDYLLGLAG